MSRTDDVLSMLAEGLDSGLDRLQCAVALEWAQTLAVPALLAERVPPDTADLSAQTEACRALSAENERLKAELVTMGRVAAEHVTSLAAQRDAALAVIERVRDYVAEDLSEPHEDEDGERLKLFVYPSQIRGPHRRPCCTEGADTVSVGMTAPRALYGESWTELTGWVTAAKEDAEMIDPTDLLRYMAELRHRALAPIREWLNAMGRTEETP